MKEYGYFSKNSFVITKRDTPRHWYNYLFNDKYIASVSQVGVGKSYVRNADSQCTKFINDRAVYIVEDSRFWQATALPVDSSVQHYQCTHAIGYTDISLTQNRVKTVCRFFVGGDGNREFLRLIIKNQSHSTKQLKVIPYYAMDNECDDELSNAAFCDEKNCVIAKTTKDGLSAYLMSSDIVTGFDTRETAFIGTYGNKLMPTSLLENKACSNSDCIAEKCCLAVENTVTLAPGESKTFYYTIGLENSENAITQFLPAEIEEQFITMQKKYKALFDDLQLRSPWNDLNGICNDWLKYQTLAGAHWGKISRITNDAIAVSSMCLSTFKPTHAAQNLSSVLKQQRSDGFLPTDNIWTAFAVFELTKESASFDFLQQKLPFVNGENATVYEHIKRHIAYLWNHTDYNGFIAESQDNLTDEGHRIWISIAFVKAAKFLAQMANWMGYEGDSKSATHYAQEMENRVNRYAWKNNRYLAPTAKDARLFALPQIWSVLAGFDKERQETAMDTLEQFLNTELGVLTCSPFRLPQDSNIDINTAVWKLAADCLLKRNDLIEEGLRKILPMHNEFFATNGEPYALFDYYYGEQSGYRIGTPSQAWHTVCGAKLLFVLIRFVYGLKAEFGGLLIQPVLPPSWKDCSISKNFRGCCYNIHYIQKDAGICNTVDSIFVNGVEVNPLLPIKPQPNKTLNIEVILRT